MVKTDHRAAVVWIAFTVFNQRLAVGFDLEAAPHQSARRLDRCAEIAPPAARDRGQHRSGDHDCQRTGIKQRYVAGEGETTSTLAIEAARKRAEELAQ